MCRLFTLPIVLTSNSMTVNVSVAQRKLSVMLVLATPTHVLPSREDGAAIQMQAIA